MEVLFAVFVLASWELEKNASSWIFWDTTEVASSWHHGWVSQTLSQELGILSFV